MSPAKSFGSGHVGWLADFALPRESWRLASPSSSSLLPTSRCSWGCHFATRHLQQMVRHHRVSKAGRVNGLVLPSYRFDAHRQEDRSPRTVPRDLSGQTRNREPRSQCFACRVRSFCGCGRPILSTPLAIDTLLSRYSGRLRTLSTRHAAQLLHADGEARVPHGKPISFSRPFARRTRRTRIFSAISRRRPFILHMPALHIPVCDMIQRCVLAHRRFSR